MNAYYERQLRRENKNAAERVHEDRVAIAAALDRNTEERRNGRHDQEQREDHSRSLADRQANTAQQLNKITIGAVVVSTITLIVLIWTVIEARSSTEQANRGWMGLDERGVIIDDFRENPWAISAHYGIKNFGHGPALKVNAVSFVEDDPKQLNGIAKFICSGAESISTGTVPATPETKRSMPGPLGRTLFPEQGSTECVGATTCAIASPWEGAVGRPTPKSVSILGCVAYLDQFRERHWTRFCVEVPITNGHAGAPNFCGLYNDTDETKKGSGYPRED